MSTMLENVVEYNSSVIQSLAAAHQKAKTVKSGARNNPSRLVPDLKSGSIINRMTVCHGVG